VRELRLSSEALVTQGAAKLPCRLQILGVCSTVRARGALPTSVLLLRRTSRRPKRERRRNERVWLRVA